MNILVLGQREIDPIVGGIERVSWLLTQQWAGLGHHVVSLSLVSTPNEYYQTPVELSECSLLPCSDVSRMACQENEQHLVSLIQKHHIQVVINQMANIPQSVELCAKVREREKKVRWVSAIHFSCHYHCKAVAQNFFIREKLRYNLRLWIVDLLLYFRFELYEKRRLLEKERREFRRMTEVSDCVVLLSEREIPVFLSMIPKEEHYKLCAISNPISPLDITSTAVVRKKQLLYVGRLELGQKRVDRLIRIWANLEKSFPDWELVIVGDGIYRHLYEQMTWRRNLQRVRFTGYANSETYYAESAVLCLTSTSEGFGMVLVEAQRQGCIPIAYGSYQAVYDIIDNDVNGYIIPPFNQKAFKEGLMRLMSDADLRTRLSSASREKVKQFELPFIANQWECLLKRIINNSKK